MTTQKRKLISLNLAALLILLLALPVGAAEPTQTGSEGLREALLTQQLERIAPAGEEEQAELSAQEPYRLQVGTTVFKSDQDRSGTGWARMLDAAVASCGTGDVRLTVTGSPKTPNQVKLFVLDNDLAPTCACLETVVFSTQDQN